MHALTLHLPDDIYEPLLREAQREGSTPEAVVSKWVATAVRPSAEDPLLQLLGSIQADVPDVAQQHNEYIGQAIRPEIGPRE